MRSRRKFSARRSSRYPAHVDGHDIPQANSLDRVRAVVRAILEGAEDAEDIGKVVDLSPRHTDYYLQAARILDLIEQGARAWCVASCRVASVGVDTPLLATLEDDERRETSLSIP